MGSQTNQTLSQAATLSFPAVFQARYRVAVESQTTEDRVAMVRRLAGELASWADAMEGFNQAGARYLAGPPIKGSFRMNQQRLSGLPSPNTFPVPDALVDLWLSNLGFAELKCMLYACRRVLGFHKHEDAISLSQFCEGIAGLDSGTGLSRTHVVEALSGLVTKGLLERRKQHVGDVHASTVYSIRWDKVVAESDHLDSSSTFAKFATDQVDQRVVGQPCQAAVTQGDHRVVTQGDHGSHFASHGVVTQGDQQETVFTRNSTPPTPPQAGGAGSPLKNLPLLSDRVPGPIPKQPTEKARPVYRYGRRHDPGNGNRDRDREPRQARPVRESVSDVVDRAFEMAEQMIAERAKEPKLPLPKGRL